MTVALAKTLERNDLRTQREARNRERLERAERAFRMGIPTETITKLFELTASDAVRVSKRARAH